MIEGMHGNKFEHIYNSAQNHIEYMCMYSYGTSGSRRCST